MLSQIGFSQQENFVHYSVDNGLPSSVIQSIYQDQNKLIHIQTQKGSVLFNGYEFLEDNNFKALKSTTVNNEIPVVLKDKNVTCSLLDFQQGKWFGTEKYGLYYFPNYQAILPFTEKINFNKTPNFNIDTSSLKLENKIVHKIIKYNDKILVASDSGLLIYSNIKDKPNANKTLNSLLQTVTKKNGLPSSNITNIALHNNDIVLQTQYGNVKLDLSKINQTEKLEVIFPYVRKNNEKFLNPATEIIIEPEYKFLTLKYLALDYKSQGNLVYKYKIDGIHTEFIETKDTKIQFTSLPPEGDYLFSVQVKQLDDSWSKTSSINLKFLVPFYKQTWFIGLASIISLLLLWLLTRLYFKRKLKNETLKSELQQLESKALQSQMNPHFVFNALNSIQSYISSGDDLKSEIYLAKFSSLLRKTLNNSREDKITLAKEIENLELYLELEKMRFQEKLSFIINVSDDLEKDLITIPPMLIQPFVENAILHGISPKKENGIVHINLALKDQNNLSCIITDDGVGRFKNITKSHKSLGTSIVNKRIDLLKTVKSSFKNITYTDLIDNNSKPTGTKVEIIIPI